MKRLNIIHLGIGNVGKTLVGQIADQADILRDKYLVDLAYCGLFNSGGGYFDADGFHEKKLNNIIDELDKKKFQTNKSVLDLIDGLHQPFVLIDTTSSEKTFPIIFSALAKGGYVVLSNKKPLAMRQEQYDLLQQLGQNRLFCETTVGAGLPVINTLKTLIGTGDEITEISGCFSGTLGFLCSSLEDGMSFSESVLKAKGLGFTEADPRDDLSGADVGRKALILARVIGLKLETDDIKVQKLYPDDFGKFTVDGFLQKIGKLDEQYKEKFKNAKNKGNTFRYAAKISKKGCQVGLIKVPKNSDLGSLKGPDNMIVFKTKRYFDRPMVIKGPGAGPEVTAAGVFGDILNISQMI